MKVEDARRAPNPQIAEFGNVWVAELSFHLLIDVLVDDILTAEHEDEGEGMSKLINHTGGV